MKGGKMKACPFKLNSIVPDCISEECQWWDPVMNQCFSRTFMMFLAALTEKIAPPGFEKIVKLAEGNKQAHTEPKAADIDIEL